MKRNILDIEGNIIGELELPDNTSEEEWQLKLSEYLIPTAIPVKDYPDVTPRQIRQALILSGITIQQIEDALNSLEEPTRTLAKIEWEYSTAFQRKRPIVSEVARILGWTEEQLDSLWELAGSI